MNQPDSSWIATGMLLFYPLVAITGYIIYLMATGSAYVLFDRYILFRYSLNLQERGILEHKNSFYRNLKPSLKRKFECNVVYFIKDKDFEGREGFIVRDDMKLQIAAAATQISFGHFPTIY